MKYIYILKIGSTYPFLRERHGDFDEWTRRALGPMKREVRVLDIENGEHPPELSDCASIIITGSHAMVTDELPWSVNLERWLPSAVEKGIPLLGICYGHQLLARALGGTAGYHPLGRETGTVEVECNSACGDDPLFSGLPEGFLVHSTHAQSVHCLPHQAVRLAANSYEANHAFRAGECAWGVQFHPEYTVEIMRAYIYEQREELENREIDVEKLVSKVKETTFARSILQRFSTLSERMSS
jgi:GMP synthase (glutamine-hydrolysing)